MSSKSLFFASSALLLAIVSAVPTNDKREIAWFTQIIEDVVTVPITLTVWVDPVEATDAATSVGHYGHLGHNSRSTSTEQPAVTVQPAQESSANTPATISTSSSVYVAPVAALSTSTSLDVAPAPTSAAAPAAASTYSGSSSGGVSSLAGTSHSGDLTFYDVGMGACGIASSAGEKVLAISHSLFDQYTPNGNPNNNPLCGATVNIKSSTGSIISATIVDRCVGCSLYDLDLSTGLWAVVEPSGDGRIHGASWSFA